MVSMPDDSPVKHPKDANDKEIEWRREKEQEERDIMEKLSDDEAKKQLKKDTEEGLKEEQ